jgi:hypothetical protein
MLAFTFKGIFTRARNRVKEVAALIAELASRQDHGPAMAALNRRKQDSPAPAAYRRLLIDRIVALEADHMWRAFRGTIIAFGN